MAFPYSSKEEPSLALSAGHEEKLIELDAEFSQLYELAAETLSTPVCERQPDMKAPRPNKARRALHNAHFTFNQFLQRRRKDCGDDKFIPLYAIKFLLNLLDIRGVAAATRGLERACPASADELYDRLVYSRAMARRQPSSYHGCSPSLARRILGSCDPTTRRHSDGKAARLRWCELPELMWSVLEDMGNCLSYVEAFKSLLDLETEGCDRWVDLSQLRRSVFRLTGYWPHNVEHDLEAWAFGLPNDLARLLYPQGGRLDHQEMALNLDELILGPGDDAFVRLERFMQNPVALTCGA